MKFYLVKNKEVLLRAQNDTSTDSLKCIRAHVPVNLEPFEAENVALLESECSVLISLLQDNINHNLPNSETGLKCLPSDSDLEQRRLDTELDWHLEVTLRCKKAYKGHSGFIKISGAKHGNILKRLKSVCDSHAMAINLKVEICNLVFHQNQKMVLNAITNEVSMDELSNCAEDESEKQGVDLHFSVPWTNPCRDQSDDFYEKGMISIMGTLYYTRSNLSSIFEISHPTVLKKILKEGVYCDAKIVSNDGVEIKCHKAVLAVQSPVLEVKFKDMLRDNKASIIKLAEMTEAGVRALLDYLYCREDKQARQNSAIALELLQGGHDFNIPELSEIMNELLLSGSDFWYNVEVALKLFLYSKNVSTGEALKRKAVELLKLKYAVLKTSAIFKQLFKNDPETAMELCDYLINA